MNRKLSKQIYSELIVGKYINKNKIEDKTNLIIDNELFIELEKNLIEYEELFSNIGYELHLELEYAYLTKDVLSILEEEKSIDKTLLKEYVLFNCILRYIFDNKIDINNTLNNIEIGLSIEEMNKIFNEEKFSKILETVEISKSNKSVISDILIKRNIFEKNKIGNACLTNIGKEFLFFVEKEGNKLFQN